MTQKETGIRYAAALLFILMLGTAASLNSPIWSFFDIPSFMITVAGGTMLTIVAHGRRGLSAMWKVAKEGGSKAQFEFAQTVASGAATQFERAGWLGTGIGIIQMLQNIDDPKSIGPAMAVSILCPLYAHIISAFVFHPMARNLEARSKMA